MNVGELRRALESVNDDMVVLLRVSNEDGDEQFMCSPSDGAVDPGCADTDCFVIDGTDGECEHGLQSKECKGYHGE